MGAKAIKISNDGGTTYVPLPGSQGAFDSDAEGVDDTILGQIYQSNEVGLKGWVVNSDGIFKGFAGYLAELKQVGAAVAFTTESMSVVSGLTYEIDDAAKSIWDRSEATMEIQDDASPVADANIESIDYLFGRVTFISGYSVVGAITATGKSFPTSAIGCANSYNLTMTADPIDETCFNIAQGNAGSRVFRPGLRTVALELTGVFQASANLKAVLEARNEVIIEIDPVGDGSSIARGFFKLMTTGQSGAVGALEEQTSNWQLTVPDETSNPQIEYPFSWKHTATTLNLALQWLLTSWLDGLNTYDVQYLPTGATGASPDLDGIEGDFMVADISLSGGLSNMNVFQASLQGTGEYTEV